MSYEHSFDKPEKGLSEKIVSDISAKKNEPQWMLLARLSALDIFFKKPLPSWGPDLSALDIDDIYYYINPVEKQQSTWDLVPENIKNTFSALGIPQAEQKF